MSEPDEVIEEEVEEAVYVPRTIPVRDAGVGDLRYDIEQAEEQTRRAATYYGTLFERHDKSVIVAEIDGIVMVAGRGMYAESLREWADGMNLKVSKPK